MVADNKHLLTGTNLTGYSCHLCNQSWGKAFTLDEITHTPCEPRADGLHVYHLVWGDPRDDHLLDGGTPPKDAE